MKVKIKLEQSFSKSEDIGGYKIETVGSGKVDSNADEHGIINYTKVVIEFEDEIIHLDESHEMDFLEHVHIPLKIASIQVLD